MQKKIGIITFHNCVNYGAVLQTYALYEVLSNDGFAVEVIDYVNKKIEGELNSKGRVYQKNIKGFVKAEIKKYHGYRKKKAFTKFIDTRLRLSTKRNITRDNIDSISDIYDVYITGSDQVWNFDLTGNDFSYYLDFVTDQRIRIAYAVSAGDKYSLDFNQVFPFIDKFNAISVREKSLNVCLRENYNINTSICCDPTLLANRRIFESIKSKRLINKKYIFCFLMAVKPGIMDVAKAIAKEKGLVLIDNKTSIEFFLHSSPEDYLSWIYNAEYILTDSFHGTVFSIIFNKQFVSDKYDGNGNIKNRIRDLLVGLLIGEQFQDITLENINSIRRLLYKKINYAEVEKERKELASRSHDWLIKSIMK